MIRVDAALVVILVVFAGCLASSRCCVKQPQDAEESLFRYLARASVQVDAEGQGRGSGVVVESHLGHTLVLTCAHVIENGGKSTTLYVISSWNGEKTIEVARLLKSDPAVDLALLEVATWMRLPALSVAKSDPGLYERLYSVSSPDGLIGHPDTPRLAAIEGHPQWSGGIPKSAPTWRLSGMVLPGSSGGAVANARGELIGLLQGWHELDDEKHDKVASIAYAVPRSAIEKFLTEYRRK